MHPEFRQTTIRQRERELGAALRNAHAHESRKKEDADPSALRLIWAGSTSSWWTTALAPWRIAGG
jgi:hypothetical protein